MPSTATSPNPRRILLMGATGTIGRATARALAARGHSVVCAVRPKPDTPKPADRIEHRPGDVTDSGSLDRDISVVVAGSVVPLTVRLLDPAGNLIATGDALIAGLSVSGLDKPVSAPGLYRVQVVNAPGSFSTIQISIARTVLNQ